MDEPKVIEQHGRRIITALEHAWAAIQDQHPDVPGVVIVTGAGSNQKDPRGVSCAAATGPSGGSSTAMTSPVPLSCLSRASCWRPEAGRWWRSCCTRPPAPWPPGAHQGHQRRRNRYHNKWFVALAAELCLRGPDVTDKITAWSNCALTGASRLRRLRRGDRRDRRGPAPVPGGPPARPGGKDGGQDQGGDGPGKPSKRGGRRVAVECTCQPEGRRLQLTPRQIEDGPIVCGLCCARSRCHKMRTRPRGRHRDRRLSGQAISQKNGARLSEHLIRCVVPMRVSKLPSCTTGSTLLPWTSIWYCRLKKYLPLPR